MPLEVLFVRAGVVIESEAAFNNVSAYVKLYDFKYGRFIPAQQKPWQ